MPPLFTQNSYPQFTLIQAMITSEQVIYIIPILGLTASIFYYAMVLRHQNKSRETQLFTQIFQNFKTVSIWREYLDHQNMEWEDYDDFHRKYGMGNLDTYSKTRSVWWTLCNIGRLVLDGMIEKERVYAWVGSLIIGEWNWSKPLVEEWRRRDNNPHILSDFEYIGEEMIKMRAQHNLDYHIEQ